MSLAVVIEAHYLNITVAIQFYDNMSFITPKQVVFWYILIYKKEYL